MKLTRDTKNNYLGSNASTNNYQQPDQLANSQEAHPQQIMLQSSNLSSSNNNLINVNNFGGYSTSSGYAGNQSIPRPMQKVIICLFNPTQEINLNIS